jgi:hypothetical protein
MATASADYPVTLSIDYPDRKLSRLTTFFRLIMLIPIAIVLAFVNHSTFGWVGGAWSYVYTFGGLVVIPLVLMLLFRKKYPRWWFDWNLGLARFSARVAAYFALLRDEYPSTDEEQAVHLNIVYPNAKEELNRWLPLVKWIAAVPHYIVLFFLAIAALVVMVVSWFAILFTGRYPRDLFDFVVGVQRWGLRVSAYAVLMATDRYPPFRLTN